MFAQPALPMAAGSTETFVPIHETIKNPRILQPFRDSGVDIPTILVGESVFKPIIHSNVFGTVRCTKAGSILRIRSPYSAPRPEARKEL
jgi:hypothetical protein